MDARPGWALTDCGLGDARTRLPRFTVPSGSPDEARSGTGRTCAEELLLVRDGQVTGPHFHHRNPEDTINRGGGQLERTLCSAARSDTLGDMPAPVEVLARPRTLPAGSVSSVNDEHAAKVFYGAVNRFPGIGEDEAPDRPLVAGDARRRVWGGAR